MTSRPASDGFRLVVINALYLVGVHNIALLTRFALAVAAAIYLGPALYGMYLVAYALYLTMLPLAGGGLQFILSREIGRDADAGGRIVFPSLLVRLGLALITAFICFFSGWIFDDRDGFRLLMAVFALALIGRSIAVWVNAVFTAHHLSRYNLALELIFRIAEVVVAVFVLSAGYGVVVLALVHAASWWTQAIAGLWVMQRRFSHLYPVWQPSLMARLLRSGIPLALILFLITWQLQGPIVLFKWLAPSAVEVGQLALSFQIFLTLGGLSHAVSHAVLPALSAAADFEDAERRFLSLATRVGILAGTIFALTGWAFGTPLIVSVFGAAYEATGTLMGPVLLLFTPLFIGDSLWQTFVARLQARIGLICALQGALVSTLAVWILASVFAGLGAIIGAGIGLSIWVVCLLHRSQWSPAGGDGRRIGLALGLSAGALAAYFALASLLMKPLAFIGVTVSLLIFSWLLVFSANDRRMLKGIALREPGQ
jgi:O-antigen/teichoic acid export membrane protein